MLRFEQEAWKLGHQMVAGIDEAGRGPLAGPVVAAAVIIEREYLTTEAEGLFAGLNDSKKLTQKKREFFFELLHGDPKVSIGIGIIPVDVIDRVNILNATHRAMAVAVRECTDAVDFALVDGLPVHGLHCSSRAVIKGDSQSLSIAAASVIAKVTRDRLMLELDAEYPDYGFARHKGYGTAEHLHALKTYGATPHHRRSFRPVAEKVGLISPRQEQLKLF